MVGLIEKPEHITTQWFKDEGDAIILLGDAVDASDPLLGPGRLGLSAAHSRLEDRHAAALRPGKGEGAAPGACWALIQSRRGEERARLQRRRPGGRARRKLHQPARRARDAAADWGDGGFDGGSAASRRAVGQDRGQSRRSSARRCATLRLDALLFGETQSRVVITCKPLDAVKVVERAKLMGVPAVQIGKVGGDKLTIKTAGGEFGAPVTELHDAWWNAIARAMA